MMAAIISPKRSDAPRDSSTVIEAFTGARGELLHGD